MPRLFKVTEGICNRTHHYWHHQSETDEGWLPCRRWRRPLYYILVRPNGSKLWRYDYRLDGSRRTHSIGEWGRRPKTGLAQAGPRHVRSHFAVIHALAQSHYRRRCRPSRVPQSPRVAKSTNRRASSGRAGNIWLPYLPVRPARDASRRDRASGSKPRRPAPKFDQSPNRRRNRICLR